MSTDTPVIRPEEYAVFSTTKMGKATLFQSPRLLVGLNAFEAGQQHDLHTHGGMDKLYSVLSGQGFYLMDGSEVPIGPGDLVVAPAGIPHGIRNPGPDRLLLLAILAPGPQPTAT